MPDHYDPNDGIPYAKNELRLFPKGAQYGFYIERADHSRGMGSSWHWWPFLQALQTDVRLQEQLLLAMQEHNLSWLLQLETSEGRHYSVEKTIRMPAGRQLLWDETDNIDWTEFVNKLQAVPADRWPNVHLCAWTEKQDALAAGERFADEVSTVFRAILPLYLACAVVS